MKPRVLVILAGGVGKRFWPIQTNKLLFPFFGKPFFQHTIMDALPKHIDSIVVVTNSENTSVFDTYSFPAPHKIVLQTSPRGMADAILTAEPHIAHSELFILIANDLYDQTLLSQVIQKRDQSDTYFGILPAWKTPGYFPGGYLTFDKERITGIIEKPDRDAVPSEYVNMSGSYITDSDILLSELKKTSSPHDDVYEQTLNRLMATHEFTSVPYTGAFTPLKYPWHVLDCMQMLLANRLPSGRGVNVSVAERAVIKGPVYLADHVRVFDGATIIGPTYIGPNTVIGNNAFVRESHIGAECVIGYGTDVARSYIGDSCWFHANYIGDSVLEKNISFGYGTGTANFRLDEGIIHSAVSDTKISTDRSKVGVIIGKDVRVGIQTGFMPGVKIGHQSVIGPGIIVSKDIPDETYAEGSVELRLKKNTVPIKTRSAFH